MKYINLSIWIENNIIDRIIRCHDVHKKALYRCCVCGLIVSPYFSEEKYSLKDMGWKKVGRGRWYKWICHQCEGHRYASASDKRPFSEREYNWDEWQEFVASSNAQIKAKILNKDPEYYDYWFAEQRIIKGRKMNYEVIRI